MRPGHSVSVKEDFQNKKEKILYIIVKTLSRIYEIDDFSENVSTLQEKFIKSKLHLDISL